ncbi:hypothetical protein HMI55_005145 [Coelomomyces lativittatus]|nr:hypothetical protein HMI55_005145 [Coelomomyces lativittatus]
MQFPSSTLVDQWWYAVRHVTRLGVHPPRWSWLAGVVYVVESLHMNEVRAMASNDPHGLLHPSSPPLLTVVTVAKLPRNAMIEIVPFGIVGVHPDLGPTPLSSWSSSVYKKEVQPHWTFLGVHAGSSWGVYFTVTFHGTYPTPSTDLLSPPGGMRDVVKMYMDKVGGSLKQLLFLQCFFNGALMATSGIFFFFFFK